MDGERLLASAQRREGRSHARQERAAAWVRSRLPLWLRLLLIPGLPIAVLAMADKGSVVWLALSAVAVWLLVVFVGGLVLALWNDLHR